uniref:Uncharacterized protein n=1 Tax=Cannabis sativa TaxID=3483 RepID=A0A803PLR4_CANSA
MGRKKKVALKSAVSIDREDQLDLKLLSIQEEESVEHQTEAFLDLCNELEVEILCLVELECKSQSKVSNWAEEMEIEEVGDRLVAKLDLEEIEEEASGWNLL